MEGPASDIGFYLGATSLSDLSDRIEFVDVVQQDDADLAQEVLNLRNQLAATEDRLEELQSVAQTPSARRRGAAGRRWRPTWRRSKRCSPTSSPPSPDAAVNEKQAQKAYEEWQAELAATGYGAHSSVALPEQWQGVFEACPVAEPRGFGDGFGAPRYVGGYHLHKGVDIVAPMGTPILATFDGMASDATNAYGGNAVYVHGPLRLDVQRPHDVDREARPGAGGRRDRLRR